MLLCRVAGPLLSGVQYRREVRWAPCRLIRLVSSRFLSWSLTCDSGRGDTSAATCSQYPVSRILSHRPDDEICWWFCDWWVLPTYSLFSRSVMANMFVSCVICWVLSFGRWCELSGVGCGRHCPCIHLWLVQLTVLLVVWRGVFLSGW